MADDTIDVTHDLAGHGDASMERLDVVPGRLPGRVQMDSQLRLGAYLGVLSYLGADEYRFGTMGNTW